MALYAGALGIVGGGAAWVLLHLIGLMTNLLLFGRIAWKLPSLRTHPPGPIVLLSATVGGLAIAGLARWTPMIRGHGIPETMEAVLERQSRIAPRAAIAKPISAAIAIGTGGPFGAEGPIIVTGGAIGSLLGQVVRVSPAERKTLLACGAAAGMAATFGAPLASVVLAVELLLFEFNVRSLVPLVVASSVAGGMHAALFGPNPLFSAPAGGFSGLDTLPLFAVLGLACGLLAVAICKGLYAVERGFHMAPVPDAWHPVLGALAFAVVGLVVPAALGVGYDSIDAVLAGQVAIGTLGALLIAKLVAWWIALGSGTSGGTLAPILLIGGCFGALCGHLATSAGLTLPIGVAALVAMAATFGAATRAPFTAMVFAFELTRDYRAILPLMLATVVAHLVSAALLDHALMTEKLARRGVEVPAGYEPNVLKATTVGQVMTTRVVTAPLDAPIAEVRRMFTAYSHSSYPLVDRQNRCVGIVTRSDVLHSDGNDEKPVSDIASSDVVTTTIDSSLLDALTLIIEEDVGHLPVLEGDRLVGIVTRTDVLRAPHARLAHDALQEPWRPDLISRRRSRQARAEAERPGL